MVPRSDALVNLSSLLRHAPGSPSDVEAEGLLVPSAEELAADGLRVAGPLHWQLVVRSTGGDDDYLVDGKVSGTVVMECRRCLEDVEVPVEASFVYEMVYQAGKTPALTLVEAPLPSDEQDVDAFDDVDEDHLLFGHPEVDFGPLLVQWLAIEQPLTVLCQPDCRGLSIDGVNLNEHPGHVPAEGVEGTDAKDSASSPFAALADLDVESST